MLPATVRRTIVERALIPRSAHVIVACSGGPDSVAMLHVLRGLSSELGFTLAAASVDHGIRKESAGEVERVGALASTLAIPFHRVAVAVDRKAASLQGAARDARYAALSRLAKERNASRIAVGHTRDDQAETVLDRLMRGGGVAGLAGIAPLRDDGVVRPLLDATRAEVISYVRHHQLPTISDPSNEDVSQRRARIRRFLLPLLVEEDSSVVAHLANLADDARDAAAYLDSRANEWLDAALTRTNRLEVQAVTDLPRAVRDAVISRWIERVTGLGPGRRTHAAIEQLLESGARSKSGPVRLPQNWCVALRGSEIALEQGPRQRGDLA